MTTSELLFAATGFLYMPAALRRTQGPQFTLSELDSVPPPLPRWLQVVDRRVGAPDLAFTLLAGVRQPQSPHTGLRVAPLTRLQRSLNAAARNLACPAPVGTFTAELAHDGSLRRTSAMTTWILVLSMTRLSLAALTALWAARKIMGRIAKIEI
jgi:hypothetical protein